MGEDQKRDDEQIMELCAEVQRLTALVRSVDLFGTGFVWTDPKTGKRHVLHPADVSVLLAADQQTEIEKIKESAYRAGREDAARDIDEWADGYESFARGESNTELVVTNLRHAGRIAREGQGAPWIGHDQEQRP